MVIHCSTIRKSCGGRRTTNKTLSKIFYQIFPFLKTKKKEEVRIPERWKHHSSLPSNQDPPKPKVREINIAFPKKITIPTIKFKIQIPHLLRIKRFLAGILLLINGIFIIGSSSIGLLGLVFFLNCFVLLDYLFKTRRKKQV